MLLSGPRPGRRLPVVAGDDLEDGVAVRREVALEAERLRASACRSGTASAAVGIAVDAVVGAHDRARAARPGRSPRNGVGVVLAQRAVVHVGRAGAAVDLAVVGRVVLDRRDRLLGSRRRRAAACRCWSLPSMPLTNWSTMLRVEQRVLAVGLVVAAPARVAREVHRRRVEVEVEAVVAARPRAPRRRSALRLAVDQVGVPADAERLVDRVRRRVGQRRRVAAVGRSAAATTPCSASFHQP